MACFRVPHPRRFVRTGSDDTLAIGREDGGTDCGGVTAQSCEQMAGVDIPHLRRMVVTSSDDVFSVG